MAKVLRDLLNYKSSIVLIKKKRVEVIDDTKIGQGISYIEDAYKLKESLEELYFWQ